MYAGVENQIIVKLFESPMYEYESSPEYLIPAAGIMHDDLTAKVWKPGYGGMIEFLIDEANWLELDGGNYVLTMPEDFSSMGTMFIRLTGDMISPYEREFFIEPQPRILGKNTGLCEVYGNVLDLGLQMDDTCEIAVNVVHLPHQIERTLLTAKSKKVYPDSRGDFGIELAKGATVKFTIRNAGIDQTIIIPEDKDRIHILDLLPPIPN